MEPLIRLCTLICAVFLLAGAVSATRASSPDEGANWAAWLRKIDAEKVPANVFPDASHVRLAHCRCRYGLRLRSGDEWRQSIPISPREAAIVRASLFYGHDPIVDPPKNVGEYVVTDACMHPFQYAFLFFSQRTLVGSIYLNFNDKTARFDPASPPSPDKTKPMFDAPTLWKIVQGHRAQHPYGGC